MDDFGPGNTLVWSNYFATSHDLGPQKVAKEGKSSAISGKSRLVKYYNLARLVSTPSCNHILPLQNESFSQKASLYIYIKHCLFLREVFVKSGSVSFK